MAIQFVSRGPAQFTNLSNSKIPLFDLEHPIIINEIRVCNISNIPIRVSLQLKGPSIITYLNISSNIGIKGNINLCIPVPYPDKPEIMQTPSQYSLPVDYTLCVFSESASQKFDCTIFYSQLNELPEFENVS